MFISLIVSFVTCCCISIKKNCFEILHNLLLFSVKEPALTTAASRENHFFLTVALSTGGWARGELFWDDGDSLRTFESQNYCYVNFTAGQVGTVVSRSIHTTLTKPFRDV